MAKNRGSPPAGKGNKFSPIPVTDTNKDHPRWCFRHMADGYTFEELDNKGRASFLSAMRDRSKLTWSELLRADRHGLGSENIPVSSTKVRIPAGFGEVEKYIVFRYQGLRPMGGVRTGNVFHVVWIEREFGDVYNHGGS